MWLPERLENAVARLSPVLRPWATSSSNSREWLARSNTHSRGAVDGREKSMTLRVAGGGPGCRRVQETARVASDSTLRSSSGAASASLSSSGSPESGVAACAEVAAAASNAATQRRRQINEKIIGAG